MTSIKVTVQLLQFKKKSQKVEKQWKNHHIIEWCGTKEPLDESERSEKAGLKLNIQKMASSLITSLQIEGEIKETLTNFIFLGSKITADGD